MGFTAGTISSECLREERGLILGANLALSAAMKLEPTPPGPKISSFNQRTKLRNFQRFTFSTFPLGALRSQTNPTYGTWTAWNHLRRLSVDDTACRLRYVR